LIERQIVQVCLMEACLSDFHLIKTGINGLIKDLPNLAAIPNPNDGIFRLRSENGQAVKYQIHILNEPGLPWGGKEIY
jgi:hypothetical protein